MKQGILHIPTGRWITNIVDGIAQLNHDPFYINEKFEQEFGETKLQGVLNSFKKHRDKFVIRSFDDTNSIPIKVG